VVWQFPAGEPTALAAGFGDLAACLGVRDLLDAGDPVAQVHAVLATRPGSWLLIFDNAPGPAALQGVLPPTGNGQVLITSQDPHWPGQAVDVPVLDRDVAAAFLLTRTGSADQPAADQLAAELGGLPLALEQACAYMQAAGRSIAGYLALFRQRRADLLARGQIPGYGKQVTTTWALAFDQLQRTSPEAIGLLRLLACCAPEQIPLHLLLQPRPELAESLGPGVAPLLLPLLEDPLAADDAVAALRRYSLISPPVEGSVSVHRLVQAVTLDQLAADQAGEWRQAARSLTRAALPADTTFSGSWPIIAALLPHVKVTHNPMDEWILGWLARTAELLVLAARTHSNLGEVEKAGRVAATALAAASEAGDNWAIGWALHVLSLVTAVQGQMTDALPLFDRALTVTQADPALTDLQLLLQINKAIALSGLDRYEEAFAAARRARHLADQAGTVIRLVQAHSALGQLLFDTGRWDDALAEVEVLQEDLKEPAAACCDHGIAAVICFHRGEITAARGHLAAAVPHARRIGNRVVGPLALAHSLDSEHADALPEALAVLTAGFAGNTEELDEIEDLLADAVRLATKIGDLGTAKALAGHAVALAAESEIPHRQANALYCRGLLDHDAPRLLAAAERYGDASRPLLSAKALEAAAGTFVDGGDRGQARAAFTRAVDIYASLGAATDVARLRARFRCYPGGPSEPMSPTS